MSRESSSFFFEYDWFISECFKQQFSRTPLICVLGTMKNLFIHSIQSLNFLRHLGIIFAYHALLHYCCREHCLYFHQNHKSKPEEWNKEQIIWAKNVVYSYKSRKDSRHPIYLIYESILIFLIFRGAAWTSVQREVFKYKSRVMLINE